MLELLNKIKKLVAELKNGKFDQNDVTAIIDVLEEVTKVLFLIIKYKK